MIYWVKFLQTVSSPVRNILPAVNIALVLIILTLMTIATRTWMDPKYSGKVDVSSLTHVPKTLEPLVLNRQVNNARVINSTVQGNLFRKDRREFSPPVQRAHMVRKSAHHILSPSDLQLKGVLLLGDKKIAIMEGNYPIREGNQAIKKKPLESKGYPLGAKIGDFELTEIEKNKVTLNNNRGVVLNLNLAQRPEDKVIRKVGNTLIQKNENFDPGKIKKVSPPRSSSPSAFKRPIKKPKSVRTQSLGRPSAGTRKNPLVAPDIVLSPAQLREIAKGPYRSPLPAHLFEGSQYREFLARHGIESIEDLKVISKAQAIRRAAHKQLRALRKL
jgi:hypothetical protein